MNNHGYNVRHVHPRFIRIHKITYKHGQLLCSCPFSSTYGLFCCHILIDASSLDPTYEVNHHDISCAWWYNYHPKEHVKHSDKIKRYFKLLQQKDTTGIRISSECVEKAPIHNGPVPECFQFDDKIPKCVNYPLDSYRDELLMEQHCWISSSSSCVSLCTIKFLF